MQTMGHRLDPPERRKASVIIRPVDIVDLGKEYAKPLNDLTVNPAT